MASAPQFKIYTAAGEYIAAAKYAEDAAAIVAVCGQGDGATIRAGHAKADIVWTEGAEDQPAAESYDHVRNTIARRIAERRSKDHEDMIARLRGLGITYTAADAGQQ